MENNNTSNQTQNKAQQAGNTQGADKPQANTPAGNAGAGKSSPQAASDKSGLQELTCKVQQLYTSTAEKVNSLSTTQKVVGGSVLALGAGWVAMNSLNKKERMRENVRKRN